MLLVTYAVTAAAVLQRVADELPFLAVPTSATPPVFGACRCLGSPNKNDNGRSVCCKLTVFCCEWPQDDIKEMKDIFWRQLDECANQLNAVKQVLLGLIDHLWGCLSGPIGLFRHFWACWRSCSATVLGRACGCRWANIHHCSPHYTCHRSPPSLEPPPPRQRRRC